MYGISLSLKMFQVVLTIIALILGCQNHYNYKMKLLQLMDSDPLSPSTNDDSKSKTDIVPATATDIVEMKMKQVKLILYHPAVAPETGEDDYADDDFEAAEVVDCDRSRDCKDNC